MSFLSKLIALSQTMVLPKQYGFVQCHAHLDAAQLEKIKGLLTSSDENEKQNIISEFEKKFAQLVGSGAATSFAAGRMAFYALMQALDIGTNDEVILTAFTCSVMPNAVIKRGATPVYADVDKNTFGSSADSIAKVITPRTKLIVAQHSFGIPCDIEPIIQLAKKHGIYVVEDCAIALDSSINGVKVGNWGDAALFSTDHSKPLNTIIGGILYTKNPALHEKIFRIAKDSPPLTLEHQHNLYQQILFERKHFTPLRYPRARFINIVQKTLKKIGGGNRTIFLEDNYIPPGTSKEKYPYPATMPAFLAGLGLIELSRWNQEKAHRQKILSDILIIMKQSAFSDCVPQVYSDNSRNIVPLRFAFSCPNSKNLLQRLNRLIDINWIWFRQPVTCATEGMDSLQYISASCPISEKIGSEIFNFPCNPIEGSEAELLRGFKKCVDDRTLRKSNP